jgi:hypothetical protein
MSGWLAIGLVVIGLVTVAVVILAFDLARGDVGGGRHTMARARRLLVIATDEQTASAADRWVREQRGERPELQCFVLVEPDGQGLFLAVQDVIEREHPDALVMVRHEQEGHALTGTYGRLREQFTLPIDTIEVPAGGRG